MSDWRKEQTELRGAPEVCAVTVVYQDIPCRDRAIQVCDTLAKKFIGDLEFDITWWRFDYLADPRIAEEAVEAAARADLFLVCLEREDLPREVQTWFERSFARRNVAEGALAVVRTPLRAGAASSADAYLRVMARRANMDFLSLSDVGSAERLEDKLREDEVSSDVAGLERRPDPPYQSSGWGINE